MTDALTNERRSHDPWLITSNVVYMAFWIAIAVVLIREALR